MCHYPVIQPGQVAKFTPTFKGPFRIVSMTLPNVIITLDSQVEGKHNKHEKVHVNRLKLFKPADPPTDKAADPPAPASNETPGQINDGPFPEPAGHATKPKPRRQGPLMPSVPSHGYHLRPRKH